MVEAASVRAPTVRCGVRRERDAARGGSPDRQSHTFDVESADRESLINLVPPSDRVNATVSPINLPTPRMSHIGLFVFFFITLKPRVE